MNSGYSIPLCKLIEEFGFEEIYVPDRNIAITNPEVNRPGLALAGFFELFEPSRIQIVGRAEHRYLSRMTEADRARTISSFMKTKVAAVIITTGLEIFEDFITCATENGVPLCAQAKRPARSWRRLCLAHPHLAPASPGHGVLVGGLRRGLLSLGDSVGNSETAIELVKRGLPAYCRRRG